MRSKVIRFSTGAGVVVGILFLAALLTTAVTGTANQAQAGENALNSEDLIRFHVIANSDSEKDQALKRKVRDLIVEKMSSELAKAKTMTEARSIAESHLGEMKEIAVKEIKNWGTDYSVTAKLGKFDFPVKTYGNLTLPAGSYEAVRIVIGKGQGANWWCVLFPPLCFVDVSRAMNTSDYQPGSVAQAVEDSAVSNDQEQIAAADVYSRNQSEASSTDTQLTSGYQLFDTLPGKEKGLSNIENDTLQRDNGQLTKTETKENTSEETDVKIRFKILEFFGWSFD